MSGQCAESCFQLCVFIVKISVNKLYSLGINLVNTVYSWQVIKKNFNMERAPIELTEKLKIAATMR